MHLTKSNGLTTPNSQPAETYKLASNTPDYPDGKRLCKVEATKLERLTQSWYLKRHGPCNDYTARKFGQSRYCQDLVELNAFAVRLGVCHV